MAKKKKINNDVKKFAKKKHLVMPHGYEVKKSHGFKRHRNTMHLRAITVLAKRINKEHPNKRWQTCVKEAAKRLHK